MVMTQIARKDKAPVFLMLAIVFFLVHTAAVAHHGLAEFDQKSPIMLKGTVTEFHFTNPHCIVEFEVKTDQGTVQKWQGEMTSPAHLKGWTPTSLEPGNEVTVTGYPTKSGAHYLWINSLKSSNGTHLRTNGENLIPDGQ